MHPVWGERSSFCRVRGIRTEYHEKEELTKERPHYSQWMEVYRRAILIGLLIVFALIISRKVYVKIKGRRKRWSTDWSRLLDGCSWSQALVYFFIRRSFLLSNRNNPIRSHRNWRKIREERKNDDSLYQKALRYNEKIREDGQKESERRLELSGSADRPAKRTGYVRIYKNPKDETETPAIPWGHDGKYEKRSNDHGTDFASFR